MYEIRVTADFAAAHFLRDYNGKCENLHGHNYKVYAHVRGFQLNEGGMLIDFSLLKGALKAVCKKLDHKNLNDMYYFEQNPSAERIALFIYNALLEELKKEGIDLSFASALEESSEEPLKKRTWLYAVDVFETETSRARYVAG